MFTRSVTNILQKTMKIAIDCRMLGRSGIGTYIGGILPEMVERHHENEYLLIGNADKLARWREYGNCRIVECDEAPFSIGAVLHFPVSEVNSCDAFFTPDFNVPVGLRIPVTCMIHDIVFFDTPDFGSSLKLKIIKTCIKRALRISENVVTVSHFSKSRIESIFPIRSDLQVAGGAVSGELRAYRAAHKGPEQRDGIVFLGNLKKYKGIRTLLSAYNKLHSESWNKPLTIIGRLDFRSKDEEIVPLIKAAGDRVRLVSDATNEDVYRIVSHSEVLVSPSMYEGFGLPPLEALYLGTPVIISDIPVYKEVYSQLPVTYFRAGDSDSLAAALKAFKPHTVEVAEKIDDIHSFRRSADRILKIITE